MAMKITDDYQTNKVHRFNGIICFGGADWWYHNRAHYDLQMMREMQRHCPVLYVNSIGIRIPRITEGGMFVRRIVRKLRSFGRGFRRITPAFAVMSPISIPGKLGMRLSNRLMAIQVRMAAKRMGISKPLIWVECPTAACVIRRIHSRGLIYQRTDRYEEFPDANRQMIVEYDRKLKREADVTLYCSTLRIDRERAQCHNAFYLDHGVDFDRFSAAENGAGSFPDDIEQIPSPRVGFIGGIDSHTFDPILFLDVATRLPDMHFVLIGACSLPAGWCTLKNVTQFGQRSYELMPSYMAACDILIMPWKRNEWIEACNPVKLKEYLAVGRPIVTTDFAELRRYEGYIQRAHTAEEFASQICLCLQQREDGQRLRERVRHETWRAKCDVLLQHLRELSIATCESVLSPRSQ
jgi:glycosyltransferase involved in cell wall biosynthesis